MTSHVTYFRFLPVQIWRESEHRDIDMLYCDIDMLYCDIDTFRRTQTNHHGRAFVRWYCSGNCRSCSTQTTATVGLCCERHRIEQNSAACVDAVRLVRQQQESFIRIQKSESFTMVPLLHCTAPSHFSACTVHTGSTPKLLKFR